MPTERGHPWIPEYSDPRYWDKRTPLWLGMPKLVNLYLDLNDNKIREFLRKRKGKILDLGCGNGRFLDYADVGIDFSIGMIKRAKQKRKDLICASVTHLPFRDKSFQAAFMVDVSLHLKRDQRKKAFKEAKRVAKNFYDFLAEHRTVFPYALSILEESRFRPGRLIPYVSLLFSFPVDRIKRMTGKKASV